MEHNEAIRLQAAVKYVLGELSPAQREAYEEHYFDCPECAVDLKALVTLTDTAREVLRQEKANHLAADLAPAHPGWLRWLQPVLVSACAALLLVVVYQNLVSIPHWKGLAGPSIPISAQTASVPGPRVLPVFSLLAANARGSSHPVLHPKAREPFAVKFDITDPDPSSSSGYQLRLDDSSGAAHVLGTVPREEASYTVFVEVPAGFPPGNARLVVLGVPLPGADPRTVREITSIPFVLAFDFDVAHHP